MPHRKTKDTEPMNMILLWAVQSGNVNRDPSVLNCPQTDTENDHVIIRKEAEVAVQSLERKSAGFDFIQAELVQAG